MGRYAEIWDDAPERVIGIQGRDGERPLRVVIHQPDVEAGVRPADGEAEGAR